LDTYMDALKDFPKKADYIKTKKGKAALIKTDIFKGLMFYTYIDTGVRGPIVPLDKDRVKEIQSLNKNGEYPEDLVDFTAQMAEAAAEEKEIGFADVTGEIELPAEKRKGRGRGRKGSGKRGGNRRSKGGRDGQGSGKGDSKGSPQSSTDGKKKRPPRNKRRNKNRNNNGGPKSDGGAKN